MHRAPLASKHLHAVPGKPMSPGASPSVSVHDRRRHVPVLALSPDEAATALGVSRDYLDEHISHELRWVRRGRKKIVAVAELERWLATNAALTLGEQR